MTDNTLCKEERLRGEKTFSYLFEKGHTITCPPYKVFWIKVDKTDNYPVRFAVSVPKRRFKRAVKRNLLKRRTREVFRKNKHILSESITDNKQIHMIAIYNHDTALESTVLEEAMRKILGKIGGLLIVNC